MPASMPTSDAVSQKRPASMPKSDAVSQKRRVDDAISGVNLAIIANTASWADHPITWRQMSHLISQEMGMEYQVIGNNIPSPITADYRTPYEGKHASFRKDISSQHPSRSGPASSELRQCGYVRPSCFNERSPPSISAYPYLG